jgi:hypothetical protein
MAKSDSSGWEKEERKQTQAFESGRKLSYTAKKAAKKILHPTRDDEGKVARRRKRPRGPS